jgi:phosphoribosylanthranilate isomerase
MQVKICGINDETALDAVVATGASHVGFNFFPPSPRAVLPEEAGRLAKRLPDEVERVALFVDPDDALIEAVIAALHPDLLQLHGSESPERVAEIKQRFGVRVMKAVKVSGREDIEIAISYDGIADMILFDAKAPKDMKGALPGGNGLVFDWDLIAHYRGQTPWMLSGGLDAENVSEAIRITGAKAVDTASGAEDRPGVKNPTKIKAFVAAATAVQSALR